MANDTTSSHRRDASTQDEQRHTSGPVSAADILSNINNKPQIPHKLSTGVRTIDRLLNGGLERGKVAEIWGPPGSGRTSIALAIAANCMSDDREVTWLTCAKPLSTARLSPQQADKINELYPRTLSHLIAILRFPEAFLPRSRDGLLIIDQLSALVDLEYPRQSTFTTSTDSETRKWRAGRRAAVLGSLISYMNQLATTQGLAVVVTNGCAISSRSRSGGQAAAFVSAVGGIEWEAGTWCRLALFNDFNGRFVALQRSRGSNVPASGFGEHLAHFVVGEDGVAVDASVKEVVAEAKAVKSSQSGTAQPKKRKLEEIAASDDDLDEFNWDDSDPEVQVIG